MKKLTIKQVAEMAGVSSATVSKVLNNNGRYSMETKQRIMEIVKAHDYRPNEVAKSLRTNKSKTIGVVVPDITNEFFSHIVLAIEKYCTPLGYSVFICNSDENEEKELKYFHDLELKGVDGLIYLSGGDQVFQTGTQLPIVCIDREPKLYRLPAVTSDNFLGGYLATRKLIEKGCRNLLMLRDYRDVLPTTKRTEGYIEALREYNIPFDPEKNILRAEVGIETGKKAVEALLEKQEFSYDGIFATTDGLAYGALLALREHGIKTPDEVKIIGYDNISLATYNAISSVNQNKVLMGERAAQLLLDLINKDARDQSQTITLPIELVERQTT